AAPEAGKANRAVCELLADVLGVAARQVAVVEGPTQPRKTLTVSGLTLSQAADALARTGDC
ncbi:MAG: DUF167 domain-containing protein, partial [Phycisphaeraceae bacterium]|nr:DUF167 domain-containing protein [Phycisphaeraceae bacterium]